MFNANNMARFIGPDGTNADAQRMGEYLVAQGWELSLSDGVFEAYRQDADAEDGWRQMTEQEWNAALRAVFE